MSDNDICPSRDDAQRHVYENGVCVFCYHDRVKELTDKILGDSPYVNESLNKFSKTLDKIRYTVMPTETDKPKQYIVHDARFTPEMMATVDELKDLTVVGIESIIYHRFPECRLRYFELRKLIFKQLQRIDSAGKDMKD